MEKEKEMFKEVKRALFEDWRKEKLKEDGTYDEKLYTVTSKEFIEKCKKENLCKYEELEDGTFKAALATLEYEQQPQYEEEKREDEVLFELCLKGLDKEEIARKLNEVWNKEHMQNEIFENLSEKDKQYFYHEIAICMETIERENEKR